jgi:hypothetical protein
MELLELLSFMDKFKAIKGTLSDKEYAEKKIILNYFKFEDREKWELLQNKVNDALIPLQQNKTILAFHISTNWSYKVMGLPAILVTIHTYPSGLDLVIQLMKNLRFDRDSVGGV